MVGLINYIYTDPIFTVQGVTISLFEKPTCACGCTDNIYCSHCMLLPLGTLLLYLSMFNLYIVLGHSRCSWMFAITISIYYLLLVKEKEERRYTYICERDRVGNRGMKTETEDLFQKKQQWD